MYCEPVGEQIEVSHRVLVIADKAYDSNAIALHCGHDRILDELTPRRDWCSQLRRKMHLLRTTCLGTDLVSGPSIRITTFRRTCNSRTFRCYRLVITKCTHERFDLAV